MIGFLSSLVNRAQESVPVIRPRLQSRFEDFDFASDAEEDDQFETSEFGTGWVGSHAPAVSRKPEKQAPQPAATESYVSESRRKTGQHLKGKTDTSEIVRPAREQPKSMIEKHIQTIEVTPQTTIKENKVTVENVSQVVDKSVKTTQQNIPQVHVCPQTEKEVLTRNIKSHDREIIVNDAVPTKNEPVEPPRQIAVKPIHRAQSGTRHRLFPNVDHRTQKICHPHQNKDASARRSVSISIGTIEIVADRKSKHVEPPKSKGQPPMPLNEYLQKHTGSDE